MSERGRRLAGIALALAASSAAWAQTPAELRLLADTNLFATAPQEFRARLAIGSPPAPSRVLVEAWRGGRDRLLVRFLDPRQQGKFFLEVGGQRWFISPGAKAPVRLSPTFRLAGGLSFEEIFGIDLERAYLVRRVESVRGVVTFHLVATAEAAATGGYAAARWVVDAERRVPLRVDLLLAGDRVARIVEFGAFRPQRPLVPMRVVLKDLLRGGAPMVVELLDFEARPVPAGLFDPGDHAERARLTADR